MRIRNVVVGTCAVVASAMAMPSGSLVRTASAADARTYAAGKFGLDLNGMFAGWVSSASGGDLNADVVVSNLGPDNIKQKHLAAPKYSNITIKCGTGMSKNFCNLISSTFRGEYSRTNGTIKGVDLTGHDVRETSFSNALVTEIAFPALDGASKEAGVLQLKLTPETTRQLAGDSSVVGGVYSTVKAKRWGLGNFRVQIDGVDASRVQTVDSFTVQQAIINDAIGETRAPSALAGQMTWPNIVVTLPLAFDASFVTWQHQQGLAGTPIKNGSLAFLDDSMKNTLFQVSFANLKIVSMAEQPAGSDGVKHMKITMSVQKMVFDAPNAAFD
jgi:T4-like virus tail tube protein gp19